MDKTRNLFKKIGDTKGTLNTKMGKIKDRNSMDLTEAEYIKKRWQENTEELHKKILMTWITMMVYYSPRSRHPGVRVKWALESMTTNKASGGDGIPAELFQILKDDAVKVLYMPASLENTAVATGLEKISYHSNPKEGQCQRMFKILFSCAHFTCYQGNAQNPSG